MSERNELEQAIAALEAQRGILGDSIAETALAPLRAKLATLAAESKADTHSAIPPAASPDSERRVVTILFCDVKGSTAIAEKMDPEEWTSIMNRAFECLIAPIQRHEGTVARLMGDAILAFFGAPAAHEDDPQRAVRAGLEIVEGISTLREQLKRERGLDLQVRVGINTGLVVVGQVGSEFKGEYTAMGDAVNLAARMEQTARPGSVQIAEHTYKLVEPWFEFEPLGGIQVKGKSDPVLAYRVTGVKARHGPGRGLERQGISSPLVGREQEFNEIKSCVDRLSSTGEGGIVGIIGEAGLGKSRLVAEVRSSDTQVLWLEGHTLSFGQTISYWPFQQILRGWANITEEDDANTTWLKLESHVRVLFGEETIDYLPYLASLLALEVRGEYAERVKYLDGEAMGKQIFLTARRFFDRLARSQSTVLVFEDLHWMDESSTNLLEHLLPLVESVPLLIIGLSRPERDTPAARLRDLCARDYSDHYTEIRLAPLSESNSAQLIHNLLEIENLPSRLRELIVEKAEGNPFFLEEVIRTLIDTGAVTREPASGRWRATAQIEAIHIPDTIQGVIMARVDRLEEEVKQVLRVASVIGRSFLYRVLKAIAEAGQRLDDDLTELQTTELIREKQHLPELEYIFKHALAQEATYESILLQKRRELHARVAQAIESLFAERLEEFYGLLAYHYARAEAWEKAQDYLLKAGDQAGRMAADAEALNLYQQAMTAYARAFGDKWDPVQRASLERKMGEAFFRRGEYPQAIEHFRRAVGSLGFRLPMSRWEVRRALLRELVVQLSHRLLPGLFLKPFAESIEPRVQDEAYVYYGTAYIDAFTNSERFLMVTVRLLNLSERHGYPLGIVLGSGILGTALNLLALFRLAAGFNRLAVKAAENLQQPFALGTAYYGLQLHEFYLGELDHSIDDGRRCAQACNEAKDLVTWGLATGVLAHAITTQGDMAGALVHSQEMIRLGQDAGARNVWCWGELEQGYAVRRQGHLREAIAHQQKAIELADTIPDYIYRVIAGAELGLCYLRQGDFDRALSELEMCQRVADEHHVIEPYGRTTTLNNVAETDLFAVEHGDPSERAKWLSKARDACRAALKEAPKFRPKWPKAMRLQGTFEWLAGRPGNAQKWWQKSLAEAERMGMRYDVGMTHLEIGQRLGERAHLEKAEAMFAKIGAEVDLARTRKLLEGNPEG
jgi:class 3 adenylate cyclase/tetratricopeptide (TPR) repeat protein